MSKPLDTHDVRQGAYRGTGDKTEQSGIPDGKDRDDPSAEDAVPSRDTADGDDRSGRTQPNMGQAGTYGADIEETDVTSRNRTDDSDNT